MFGTSIHWTTFFLLLVDTFILIFVFIKSSNLRHSNLNGYLILAGLFVLYNLTGGFLPFEGFPGPFILQYVITYGVAMVTGVYLFYYIYKQYDIQVLGQLLTIKNLAIYGALCFLGLFLIPYFITDSLNIARIFFAIPLSIICLYFLFAFYMRISKQKNPSSFGLRRNRLSVLSVSCMALLPLLTVIGDNQWLTFPIVNTSFFLISAIEVDRYIYLLEHRDKMSKVFNAYKKSGKQGLAPTLISKGLTRREIEIALSIFDRKSYKEIGDEFFIAERTVSKHASNIFKKTGVKNKIEFLNRFGE
ncbi:helix-turn-helix transcriptional regulator [Aggregatimonas sangjinii]|uniref:Helix-turn-helix transcriptional regulator n=1 Tax=Aggregatimonas sangjinii TaxID=2583587 RepID=A0A5B7SU88_9FLAO|nr:helix-turn-helix transcriptional regulator [Aggregatimonas sangjinii]QCX00578.1 helix-turn-helix transcriptional regulator [Aggregatimonas sangjinii]